MTDRTRGARLIRELLADPAGFDAQGRAYQLLQECFDGLPVDNLRPLLRSEDYLVKKSVIWVVAELGKGACALLEDVVPLVYEGDRYLAYYALEAVMLCATNENVDEFVHVTRSLACDDEEIRRLAMRLVANASHSQLQTAIRLLGSGNDADRVHEVGLSHVLVSKSLTSTQLSELIHADSALLRRYGAIAARRQFDTYPEVMTEAVTCVDGDIRAFASEVIAARAS